MPWPAADGSWATKMAKKHQDALKKAKKAAEDAGAAAEAAKAALKAAEASGKGKGKSGGKGCGKAGKLGKGGGGPKETWTCRDPDCLKFLQKTAPGRGPYVNPSTSLQCGNCLAFRGTELTVKAAEMQVAKKQELEALRATVAEKQESPEAKQQQPGNVATAAAKALTDAATQLTTACSGDKPVEGEKLQLPKSEEFEALEPVLSDLRTLISEHRKPGPLPARCSSAEDNAAHFLAKSHRNGPICSRRKWRSWRPK